MIMACNAKAEQDLYPLSDGQKALWFVKNVSPGKCAYNINLAWRIKDSLDVPFLKSAIQAVVNKYPVLRTTYFVNAGGEINQKVHARMPLAFEQIDCRGWNGRDLKDVLKQESYRCIDLETGPVSRWKLFYGKDGDPVLFFSIHHIATDYGSIVMMLEHLSGILLKRETDESGEADAAFRYGEFAASRGKKNGRSKQRRLSEYWHRHLADTALTLDLPLDKPRPPVSNHRGDQYSLNIPASLNLKITDLAAQIGISRYSFFLSAYGILLHRYSARDDILISTPVSSRTFHFKEVAGYFANPVMMKLQFSSSPRLPAFLKHVHKTVFSAMLHKDYPFGDLIKTLNVDRDAGYPPISQTTFNWIDHDSFQLKKNCPVTIGDNGTVEWRIGGMLWEQLDLRGQTDEFDIVLELFNAGDNAVIRWQYNDSIFNRSSMVNMAENYLSLLNSMVRFPDMPISRLPILTGRKRHQVLVEWNNPDIKFEKNACIHQWFEEQAEKKPDAIAMIDGQTEITYSQLNRQANQVAHFLLQHHIGPETRVGISMDRKASTIACLMGIIKSGAAYVPMDPQYPSERLAFIAEDAEISVLITEKNHVSRIPRINGKTIIMDDVRDQVDLERESNPGVDVTLSNMAYVIYTSGSTGRPKGVVIEHGSVSALFNSYAAIFSENELSGVLAATSLSFDPSILDIFGTLGLGGFLILVDNPLMLSSLPAKNRVKLISAVPSTIKALLEMDALPSSVCTVGMGGEKLRQEIVDQVYSLGHVKKVFNFYGPTEETVCATFAHLKTGQVSPPVLGRPMLKTQVYIVDTHMQPVPVGVPGELCLGGPGLAREYLNRPDLTNERFVPHLFTSDPNQRLFKTGDIARYLPDGNIEFIGRKDCQVKVRGVRIELEEIETTINQYPGVRESVVTVFEDKPGESILAAYVVPEDQQTDISGKNIRRFIKDKLPAHMIPACVAMIDTLPLSSNGKVDRNALSIPQDFQSGTASTADQVVYTPTEKIVADIWQELLQLPRIDIHENFFDIGGYSLLMVSVFSKLKDHFKKNFTLVELYKYSTIFSLARFLDSTTDGAVGKASGASLNKKIKHVKTREDTRVAIVGIACRFPGAADKDTFWDNIENGIESIATFDEKELLENGVPQSLIHHKNYVPRSGWLDRPDCFDADFFNISPREAQIIDPQHRIFMECAWQALEDAGIDPDRTSDITGIYAGCGYNAYFANNLIHQKKIRQQVGDFNLMIGNGIDFLNSRIGYKLNLKGPMTTVQTACSTSMTGVHMACTGLLNGDCDVALAGGVSLGSLKKGYLFQEGMIMSANGQCRPFDRHATGTVPSQGAGIVVLKRFREAVEEKRHIYALIAGSAINNDGIGKAGFTAPSVSGQADVIRSAQQQAGVAPNQISYIEAHGTGTNVGDPIETAALETVFSGYKHKKGSCAVGAVKANIGHTDAASGVAGIIKTALALKHGKLPPSINYEQPNSHIKFSDPPFFINTQLKPWPTDKKTPRRAGVSSFGLGGNNAHTVLEEHIGKGVPDFVPKQPKWHLFPVSARTQNALNTSADRLKAFFRGAPDNLMADIAHTLQKGRRNFEIRNFFVADTTKKAVEMLTKLSSVGSAVKADPNAPSRVVFMFTGQGSQYRNMGRDLYSNEPVFRLEADRCLRIIADIHPEIFDILDKGKNIWDRGDLTETAITQPALFIFEYALAKLFIHWGIRPEYLIGHSLGEYVAACLAGVFTLEDALKIIIRRGVLIQKLPGGEMVSIGLSEEKVQALMFPGITIAAVNTPARCVVSGSYEEMKQFKQVCKALNIPAISLKTFHAFHSGMLDPILDAYEKVVSEVPMKSPQIPIVSNVTGTWMTDEQARSPRYWVEQMRGAVRFSDGMATLFEQNDKMVMMEIGPGRTLSSLAKQHSGKQKRQTVLQTISGHRDATDDTVFLLNAMGTLWKNGLQPEWDHLYRELPGFVPLPTYPFERKSYWIDEVPQDEGPESCAEVESETQAFKSHNDKVETIIEKIWTDFLGIESLSPEDDFFELGGDSLLAVMMLEQVRARFDIDVSANILISRSRLAALAHYVRDATEAKAMHVEDTVDSDTIIELKSGTREPALFLCHPGAGHLYFYTDLVKSLDIPNAIFGVEAVGLSSGQQPLDSIDGIADHHLNRIKAVQPRGPYWVGGSSFGGMVAYEVAQKLLKKGESVELLYMVDTPGPGHMVPPIRSNTQVLTQIFSDILGPGDSLEDALLRWEDDPEKQIEAVVRKAHSLGKPDMIPPQFGSHVITMIKSHVRAMRAYRPTPYPGFVLFFRQSEAMKDYAPHPELAWLPLAEGGANVYTVPGNHFTMNAAPNVNVITRQLKRHIRDMSHKKNKPVSSRVEIGEWK